MYSNMKYYENICNSYCLRVIQQDINRKLKSANCWQRTSLKKILLKLSFGWVETDILHKRKAYERKVVFSRNEDFHTKGTFYHITTGAKHLPMSFQT